MFVKLLTFLCKDAIIDANLIYFVNTIEEKR